MLRKGCLLKAWFAGGGDDGCGGLMVTELLNVVFFACWGLWMFGIIGKETGDWVRMTVCGNSTPG